MSLLGAHVSASGGLVKAVQRAAELGAESMQVFTRSPLRWGGAPVTDAEAEGFRSAYMKSGVRAVISHASYLINLASDGSIGESSKRALADEIARCDALGIDSVVLHPGSSNGGDRREAIERLVRALREVMHRTEGAHVKILLETMSGRGDTLGSTVHELADVIEALAWDDRLGVCADTCHIFAAGFDIRTEAGCEKLVRTLREQVGLERVLCWHLSDSRGGLGSNVDRHEHLGEGQIGLVPFAMLAADERFASTPAVLETPKDGVGDEGNIALLRKMRGS